MDKIKIENLEVYAYHGVYPEEKEKGQSFFVNAVLFQNVRSAGKADDMELSTDYGEVCRFIHAWMQKNPCNLIEAVAEGLAEAILSEFRLAERVALEIRKPQAPIGLPFESVSVAIERGWHQVYLSLGSNMGDRAAYLKQGIEALASHPLIQVQQVAEPLVTEPYGGVEQEDFLNTAVKIRTLLLPEELLSELHRIEAQADRKREVHWGPRTLDMDILFYDKMVYEDEKLILPHIDLQNRYFVLKPMSEIAPNLRHPILQKTITQLLSELEENHGR